MRLRRLNPSPFLFHLDFGDFQLVGSSPEILVRARDGVVTIRPIAGTTGRGATDAEDKALAAELLADPKERSEHLMLLDLGRNDVGRVSEPGSVTVTDKFVIERYSHVMHIVSNVIGKLDEENHDADRCADGGLSGGNGFRARPKVRAMEIIAELEKAKRGPYAGLRRLFLGERRDGHLHRPENGNFEGRHDPRAGRRRRRPRQHSRERAAGVHQ